MQKALFLDRDGIINVDYGYVSQIEKFKFNEGIFEFLHLFVQEGYILFIVTNQSGIGRGYYTEEDFNILTKWMLLKFQKKEIVIASVQHCNHAPEEHCSCRKPATGMINNILKEYDIDLKNSWMIGDKQSDINLAHNANIGHTIAIGQNKIINSEYAFETILECKEYLEANQARIR